MQESKVGLNNALLVRSMFGKKLQPDAKFHVHVSSMAESYPTVAQCAIVAAALKILLFPA